MTKGWDISMYFFPGYVKYYEEDGVLYISSQLLQNKVKITEAELKKEFYDLVQNKSVSQISTKLTKFLHEQELLVNEIEVDQSLTKAKQLLGNGLLLTILPTEGCNFRCPYCYETHTPTIMPKTILSKIHQYIQEQAPKFKTVRISWFGGEPTLCKDIVLETSSLVQSLQKKYHFTYGADMVTNGYLLDRDSFLGYYECGITHYQITLDGWNHDKTRPHVTGIGTLEKILNNLKEISMLPEEYQFNITLRHNVLAGDKDYSWYDHLYKLFGGDKRFSVAVALVTDWGGDTVKTLNLAEKEQRELLRLEHENYLDKIGMKRKRKEIEPFCNICYASCPNGFVFRPNGKIEKCTIALGHPKNQVGYVDLDKGIIIDQNKSYRWCHSELKKECYSCPEVLSCLNISCRKKVIVDGYDETKCLCGK